jgi:hypothetical protein
MSQPTKQDLIAYVQTHQHIRNQIRALTRDQFEILAEFKNLAFRIRSYWEIDINTEQLIYIHIRSMENWGELHDKLEMLALRYNRKLAETLALRKAFINLQIDHEMENSDHRNFLAKGLPIPQHRKQWYIWE